MAIKINSKHEELLKHLKGIQRIVINVDYGGFSLSTQAQKLYLDRAGIAYTLAPQQDRDTQNKLGPFIMIAGEPWCERQDINRDDPILVDIVRQLGNKSWGLYATLKIVESPAGVEWNIAEYDGKEWIEEKHRTWR